MTYWFANYLLARYPRTTRAGIAVCSLAAAAIALVLNGPILARVLGALFYGVVTWMALAALHDLLFGARIGAPTRFPLPGLWRTRVTGTDGDRRVVIPLHLDPSDNSGVRLAALGAVFLAMGSYLGVTGRHTGHAGGLITAVAICAVLATICLGGTLPLLYRKAGSRHVLELTPAGVLSSDSGMVAWNSIARVELVKAPIHVTHARPGPMRRWLQITAHGSHAGSVRVDVTGVASLRGLMRIITHYWYDAGDRETIGTRSSLWRIRLLRRSLRKPTARPDPKVSGRVER